MTIRRSILASYEKLLLRVARVVLVLLATGALVASIGALVWLTFLWTKSMNEDYKSVLIVPSYESIASGWSSTLSTDETNVESNERLPPVFTETVEILDSLYQLVGREEPKFSENDQLSMLYSSLIEPFNSIGGQNNIAIDFLIELKSYAESMTNDELLKRTTDVEVRTKTIVDSIFKFRDQYFANLKVALAVAEEQTSENISNRMITSSFVLQILCACVVAFIVSAICLFGFHQFSQPQRSAMQTPPMDA